MRKITLADRFRYALDNAMSRGPSSLIVWLALITMIVVVGGSLFVLLAGADPDIAPGELVWIVLLQTLSPDSVDPKAGSVVFLGTMLFVTLGSLFLVSVFIGTVTSMIDQRIQDLRKGHSLVLESNHDLILGWSGQIFTVVSELATAHENHRSACIAILADKDKVEMEDELRAKVPNIGRTRIVCRTGSPLDPTDLEIVNPQDARSVIILAPDTDDPDTFIVKSMLALMHKPHSNPDSFHVVASLHKPENLEVASLVGRGNAELVLVGEMVSRVIAQTCLQSGLSTVYAELLSFKGNEIYFKDEPDLVGMTFEEALFKYEDSSVIGLVKGGSTVMLNPPMATRFAAGDQVIVISTSSEAVRLSGLNGPEIDEEAIVAGPAQRPAAVRTLVLGWNRNALSVVKDLDNYVSPGSETLVVADRTDIAELIEQCSADSQNNTITFRHGVTTSRQLLNELEVPTFQHVIVLSNSDYLGVQEADAQVLMTLLHLRDIRQISGARFSIVTEMLDVRNRALAEITEADDFIVSDHLVSLVLAQLSQNRYLNAAFSTLFSPEVCEIYLKPAEDYVRLGRAISFHTVVESARRRGEIAIGYKVAQYMHDESKHYGVVINPNKSKRITLVAGDKIIVVSEGY